MVRAPAARRHPADLRHGRNLRHLRPAGLWGTDPVLALLVTTLAIFAPYAKTLGLALIHWHLLSPQTLTALHILGKLAPADVFLIALYIVIAKGVGHATIETAWGLYLFTACILASIFLGWKTERP